MRLGWRNWFKSICRDCDALNRIYVSNRGQFSMLEFLDLFIETGMSRTKIEAFLDAEPRGEASVKDQILADMSEEILGALGIRSEQSPADVRRLRKDGFWKNMNMRPRE